MAEDFRLLVGTKIDDTKLQAQLDALKQKTITITPIVSTGGKKEVKTLVDDMGNLVKTTTEFDSAGKKVTSTISQFAEKTQKAEKQTKSLGEAFVANTKKVAQFALSTALIGGFTSSIYKAVEAVKEMDASLVELKKVSDMSGEELASYTKDSFDMARQLSTTASNVTDAVAQFVQAGYSLEESEGLAKSAIMLQSIADESMEVSDASGFLTATLKAFNMTATDSEHIISSVNEVSNEYALTSNDLTDNLGKISSVASVAGVSFEELIGLMTSSVEKTRNASKSANAFKSIFINLQQMDASGTMPKLSEQFKEFGISMTDSSGATKNAFDLLNELSVAYQNVSKSTDVDKQNQMRTLLEDIGG